MKFYRPTHGDWREKKGEITALYRQHTLKDLINAMLERHGFDATERMYKQRFRDWGLQNKNVRDHEWAYMDALYDHRLRTLNVTTAFDVIKGGKVHRRTKKDIDKHYRRAERPPFVSLERLFARIPGRVQIRCIDTAPSPGPASLATDSSSTIAAPPMLSPHTSLASATIGATDLRMDLAGSRERRLSMRSLSETSSRSGDPWGTPNYLSSTSTLGDLEFEMEKLALDMCSPGSSTIPDEHRLSLNRLLSRSAAIRDFECSSLDRQEQGTSLGTNQATMDDQALRKHLIACGLRLTCTRSLNVKGMEDINSNEEAVACRLAAKSFQVCLFTALGEARLAELKRVEAHSILGDMVYHRNPHVHIILSWLVPFTTSQGYVAPLRDLLKDACDTLLRVAGPKDLYTPLYSYALASLSKDQGEMAKIGATLSSCSKPIGVLWGPDSPNYLVITMYEAHHLLETGDAQRAMAKLEACWPNSEHLLGELHLTTISCMGMLHRARLACGLTSSAIDIMAAAITRCERSLGRQSPYRLELVSKLANVYKQHGRPREACQLLREAVDGQIDLLGWDNQRTWGTLYTYRDTLNEQGKSAEAHMFWTEMMARRCEAWDREWDLQWERENGTGTGFSGLPAVDSGV